MYLSVIICTYTRVILEALALVTKVVFFKSKKFPTHLGDVNLPNVCIADSICEVHDIISCQTNLLCDFKNFCEWQENKRLDFERLLLSEIKAARVNNASLPFFVYYRSGSFGFISRLINTLLHFTNKIFNFFFKGF